MALTGDAYVDTYAVTDTVNAGTSFTVAANQNLAIDNRGYSTGAIYTVLNDLITKWNLCMTAIEGDGANTTTYTPDNALTALISQGFGIEKHGWHQIDIINCLTEIEDNLAAVLDLLDADTGVTLTTYNAVSLAAGNPGGAVLALGATVDGSKGISHADIVQFMENAIDKWNATMANCDADND
jgi:hypothetical protein